MTPTEAPSEAPLGGITAEPEAAPAAEPFPLADPKSSATSSEQGPVLMPPPEPTQPRASSAPTHAPSLDSEDTSIDLIEAAQIDIHGFVSQGFLLTIENNYLAAESDSGSFEMTEAGVNLTTEPIERLRLGVQLFTRDLGPIGNYEARFDWFYLDYRFEDWLGLRVGRTKVPFGLYNEINDIDVARVPILLPQSIYPTTSRDFLLAQTGVELYSLLRLGDGGNLDLRAYGGTVYAPIENTPGSPYELAGVRWPYVVGGRALWETPVEGLRAGGSVQALKLESDVLISEQMIVADPMTMMDRVLSVPRRETLTLQGVLWVASVEYAPSDLLLAAEYSRWHVDFEVSDPMLLQGAGETVSERMFALLAYRITPWFQPGLYYSLHFPNVDDRDGRDAKQHDTALTARFDLNAYWLFKLEGHFMHGTAALSPGLNDGTPRTELPRNWALLLLKTTAYF